MTILGISDSHESHACIVRDGYLLAVMSEERLSRLKADIGYPKRSIEGGATVESIAGARVFMAKKLATWIRERQPTAV